MQSDSLIGKHCRPLPIFWSTDLPELVFKVVSRTTQKLVRLSFTKNWEWNLKHMGSAVFCWLRYSQVELQGLTFGSDSSLFLNVVLLRFFIHIYTFFTFIHTCSPITEMFFHCFGEDESKRDFSNKKCALIEVLIFQALAKRGNTLCAVFSVRFIRSLGYSESYEGYLLWFPICCFCFLKKKVFRFSSYQKYSIKKIVT